MRVYYLSRVAPSTTRPPLLIESGEIPLSPETPSVTQRSDLSLGRPDRQSRFGTCSFAICLKNFANANHDFCLSKLERRSMLRRLLIIPTINAPRHGNPIQIASFCRMPKPRSVKNREATTGETRMGRQGRKWRALSKGEKKATPSPPLVMASKRPCEAPQKNR